MEVGATQARPWAQGVVGAAPAPASPSPPAGRCGPPAHTSAASRDRSMEQQQYACQPIPECAGSHSGCLVQPVQYMHTSSDDSGRLSTCMHVMYLRPAGGSRAAGPLSQDLHEVEDNKGQAADHQSKAAGVDGRASIQADRLGGSSCHSLILDQAIQLVMPADGGQSCTLCTVSSSRQQPLLVSYL